MPDKFQLLDTERATLDLRLSDGSEWHIPLMSSLTPREARELARKLKDESDDNLDVFIDFLDEKCPGLVDLITMGALNQIAMLWNEAETARGESQGES